MSDPVKAWLRDAETIAQTLRDRGIPCEIWDPGLNQFPRYKVVKLNGAIVSPLLSPLGLVRWAEGFRAGVAVGRSKQ